jgi:molybdopterin synthase sulfur carrier subunit
LSLVRVVPSSTAASEYFESSDEFELEAGNLFQLVEALDARGPGFAEAAGVQLVFAVNGELVEDWTLPLPAGAEVLIVTKISGG